MSITPSGLAPGAPVPGPRTGMDTVMWHQRVDSNKGNKTWAGQLTSNISRWPFLCSLRALALTLTVLPHNKPWQNQPSWVALRRRRNEICRFPFLGGFFWGFFHKQMCVRDIVSEINRICILVIVSKLLFYYMHHLGNCWAETTVQPKKIPKTWI